MECFYGHGSTLEVRWSENMLHRKCMECTDVSKSDEGEDWVLHVLIDKKLIPPDSLYSSETTLLNNAQLLSLTWVLSLLSLLYLLSFLILRVRSQNDTGTCTIMYL